MVETDEDSCDKGDGDQDVFDAGDAGEKGGDGALCILCHAFFHAFLSPILAWGLSTGGTVGAVDAEDEGVSEPLSTTVMTVCGIGAFDRRQRRAKSRAEESFSSVVASFNFRVSINSIVSPDIVFPFSVNHSGILLLSY